MTIIRLFYFFGKDNNLIFKNQNRYKMKKNLTLLVLSLFIGLNTSCSAQTETEGKGGNVEAAEAKELLASDATIKILDVRSPQEVKAGKIEGSVNINIQDENFKEQLEALPKDETYLVYCHAGGRSARAMKIMTDLGFTSVYNMKGGIGAWKKEGGELK